jgi:maltooligosyltrehalose synthase
MTPELTKELAAALRASEEGELEVVDPDTRRTYYLVDSETHRQAMEALRRQQDYESIAEGIRQMEAGEGQPLEVAAAEIRKRLGFPEREK